ncbi:MAG: cytochrome c biogenesis protein ResB, partial [Elusimicrobia bacterium]|nr:cytochrome c biogenesis protein ResB [Elusimicrobiota bacterium]
VTSIPESVFSRRRRIQHPSLPFSILIKRYYPNASLEMRSGAVDAPPSLATASRPSGTSNALRPSGVSRVPDLRAGAGIGTGIAVHEEPVVTRDDQQNQVTIFAEFLEGERSLGTWLLSTALGAPQGFSLGGRNFKLAIRLARHYLPFSLTLKKFSHDRYAGTDIPKNFSSLVRLQDPDRSEDRDVLISMNNPLRYGGKTFYQASFGKEDTLSILQVVENPGWLLPYVSCTLVGLGLLVHFLRRMMSARTKPALA